MLLTAVQDIGRDFKNREGDLEAVNEHGTRLIEASQDELSAASGRLKLSDLNDLWGDTLSTVAEREEKLRQGLLLAENYQVSNNAVEIW